jgi:hypothetical protein
VPPTATLTDLDADITAVFPDVELARPGIDCLDKTYFTTHKWDPLVFCRLIQTFVMGTIQEFYHKFLVEYSMIHCNTVHKTPYGRTLETSAHASGTGS